MRECLKSNRGIKVKRPLLYFIVSVSFTSIIAGCGLPSSPSENSVTKSAVITKSSARAIDISVLNGVCDYRASQAFGDEGMVLTVAELPPGTFKYQRGEYFLALNNEGSIFQVNLVDSEIGKTDVKGSVICNNASEKVSYLKPTSDPFAGTLPVAIEVDNSGAIDFKQVRHFTVSAQGSGISSLIFNENLNQRFSKDDLVLKVQELALNFTDIRFYKP